ncbi:hypothetical protein ABET36_07220 [Caldifermentibacillus hisashii]|uniref:hypothetical protein n=1 Tax=Caldifermentibacillus hisashii TaxID=996558 RepID=UPI00336742DE
MSQNPESYYVVRSVKEGDELFATIDAMSLDEANAIFQIRYKEELDQLGEVTFYIFSAKEELQFNENNRLIFPEVGMNIIHSSVDTVDLD